MKTLIAEDDLTSRKVLQALMSKYGEIDVVVNGEEAVKAFTKKWEEGPDSRYDLICLDIMMPEMSGQDALKKIREFEEGKFVYGHDGVKIIMTTALDDRKNIMNAFKSQCEAYLVKPIDRVKLAQELATLGFQLMSE